MRTAKGTAHCLVHSCTRYGLCTYTHSVAATGMTIGAEIHNAQATAGPAQGAIIVTRKDAARLEGGGLSTALLARRTLAGELSGRAWS